MNERPVRLAIFVPEFPYPPTYGGLTDIWNRLAAFRRLGTRICLVAWSSPARIPSRDHVQHVLEQVDDLVMLTFDSSYLAQAGRLVLAPLRPISVSARMQPKEGWSGVLAALKRFNPDALWVDNLTIAPFAVKVADELKCPWYLRSHNIQHEYERLAMMAIPSWLGRAKAKIRILGFEKFERDCLRSATRFFDISSDDLRYWERQGIANGEWLGPVMDSPAYKLRSYPPPIYDVSYVGSLRTNLNVAGLRWFYETVVPIVREVRPKFSILISGETPTREIVEIVDKDPYSELRANIADPRAAWNDGRVLINPVLEGSGMSLKSVEMLFEDRHLVGTTLAVRGMPDIARKQFHTGDRSEEFAHALLQAEDMEFEVTEGRVQARKLFGDARISELLLSIRAQQLQMAKSA